MYESNVEALFTLKIEKDMKNKRLLLICCVAGSLLLIPLIGMQFTSEFNWSPFDFAVMGIMLFGTGLLIELVLRKIKTTKNRLILSGLVLLLFLITWAELAVGIFDSPLAGS